MAANNEFPERHVVPRWRTFRETMANNELSGELIQKARVLDTKPFLDQKEKDWLSNKELPFAVDLVSAATMFGKSESSVSAANYILENQSKCSNVAIDLANKLLGIETLKTDQINPVSKSEIRANLKELKARRISQSGNAFVWADLARLYVLLGQKDQAKHAIKVALNLAPAERFILRSATRFFLHNKEHDFALKLLRSNSRTSMDPWLTAAEIAVSSILKKTPKFVRFARDLIENNNIQTFHKSELASSLASLELGEGRDKKANKLFLFSLKDPTENAVAQYVWTSKRNGFTPINPGLLKVQNASEARTFNANNNAQWNDVIKNAHEWSQTELFSARPRMVAASTTAYFLSENDSNYEFLNEGLKINPGHPGLVNSLAFSLAWNGKPEKAEKVINTLNTDKVTPSEALCLVATAGLILIRCGDIKEGKIFYEKAIAGAAKIKNDYLKSLAELHLAHELINLGEEKADKEFKRVYEQAIKQNATNLPFIAKSIANRIEKSSIQKSENKDHPFLTKINSIINRDEPHFGPSPFVMGSNQGIKPTS
jgi:tetratricopeptide (TPR) repeat protein